MIELALALLGGLSVLGALRRPSPGSTCTGPALVAIAFALGLLIGAEIPLLMVLLQRIREQDAGSAVADLFAADYVGALLGGLAFPFLLLPVFGQLKGALVVGAVNAVAGLALVCTAVPAGAEPPGPRRARRRLRRGLRSAWGTLGDRRTTSSVTARQQLYRRPGGARRTHAATRRSC